MRRLLVVVLVVVGSLNPGVASAMPDYCPYAANGVVRYAGLHGPAPDRMLCALHTQTHWRAYSKAIGTWSRR